MKTKRLYLCNQQDPKCSEKCSYPQCKHTSNEEFALNKSRRSRKWIAKTDNDNELILVEKEKT